MKKSPKVSVIIPTYNRSKLVTEALDSVLSQTYKDFEIIVVDDGSTDNTKEVLEHYMDKIIYIYQENQGGASARNTGIKSSRGQYIAFLDSDDMWFPQKLEKQVAVLDEYEEVSMVYSNIINLDGNGNELGQGIKTSKILSGNIFKEVLLRRAILTLPTWLVRKSCFDAVGGFDTEFRTSHDREMVLRLSNKYKIHGIKEPLTSIRRHNLTGRLRATSPESLERHWFKLLDKLFMGKNDRSISELLKRRVTSDYYFLAGRQYLIHLNANKARNRFLKAIWLYPINFAAYVFLILSLVGVGNLERAMRFRRSILAAYRGRYGRKDYE